MVPGVALAQSTEPVTIELAAWQFTEEGRGPKLEAIVDKFMQLHPNIKVEKVALPFAQFETTIFTQIGQGAGPDIFVSDDDGFPRAESAGFLAPLDDLFDWPSLNLTSANDMGIVDGKRYALIWGANTYNLIYNKDLLASIDAKAPTSYEEFLDIAEKLKSKGLFAYALRTSAAESGGMWYDVSDWLYGLGGRWSKDGKPQFDSKELVEAVTRIDNLYKSDYIPKGADAATYRRMFWEGKIGMMMDNMAVPGIIASGNPEMKDKIGIAPLPFPSGDHPSSTTYISINANSQHKEAAAEFLKYLFSQEGQLALYDMLGGVTVGTNLDLSNNPLAEKSPWLTEADTAIKAQTAISNLPQGLEQQAGELGKIFADALEEVLFADRPVDEALKDAQDRALEATGQ
jgi:multiple sugar transport system substrate-binding protein